MLLKIISEQSQNMSHVRNYLKDAQLSLHVLLQLELHDSYTWETSHSAQLE